LYYNLSTGAVIPAPISVPGIDLLNATLYNSTSTENYTIVIQLGGYFDNTGVGKTNHKVNVIYKYLNPIPVEMEGYVYLECYPTITNDLSFTAKHYRSDDGWLQSSLSAGYNNTVDRLVWTFPKAWIPAQDIVGQNITDFRMDVFNVFDVTSEHYIIKDNATNAEFHYIVDGTPTPPHPGDDGGDHPSDTPNGEQPSIGSPWFFPLVGTVLGTLVVVTLRIRKKRFITR
jgi:hypothetical protein